MLKQPQNLMVRSKKAVLAAILFVGLMLGLAASVGLNDLNSFDQATSPAKPLIVLSGPSEPPDPH